MLNMNMLTIEQKTRVVATLVEGNSVRSTSRLTGVSRNTIATLLVDLADACAEYHNRNVTNLKVRRLQSDQIWSFVGAKAKNASPEKKAEGWGDIWTWTAIDADTKFCVSYMIGGRDAGWAREFMENCASRIRSRVQITTDGDTTYLDAIEGAFGMDCDYAMLQKIYGASLDNDTKYSPAQCIGCDTKVISDNPDPKHISTSFVERVNLSMRMSIRRFTRLTNGFSKKVENHAAAVALWFMYYNFCRVHQTLRCTPAMEAGLSAHIWEIEEMVRLLPEEIARNSVESQRPSTLLDYAAAAWLASGFRETVLAKEASSSGISRNPRTLRNCLSATSSPDPTQRSI